MKQFFLHVWCGVSRTQRVVACVQHSLQKLHVSGVAVSLASGRESALLRSLCIPPPLCQLINRRSNGTDQPNCKHITKGHLRWLGSSQNHFVHH